MPYTSHRVPLVKRPGLLSEPCSYSHHSHLQEWRVQVVEQHHAPECGDKWQDEVVVLLVGSEQGGHISSNVGPCWNGCNTTLEIGWLWSYTFVVAFFCYLLESGTFKHNRVERMR